jgi:hypothetical membrane protein
MSIPTASPESLRQPLWSGSWPAPAIVAIVGFGAFTLSIAAAGALYPGYSHVREGISALAATDSPSAWIMIAGFLALAVATVSTGVTLWVRLRTTIAGRIGAALVVLAGFGMVVAALARQDCSDARAACAAAESAGTVSGHHVIHQLGSLAVFLVLTIALSVLARGLRKNRAWAHLALPTRLAGLAAFAGIAILVTVGFGAVEGLVERAVITLLFGLPIVLAALPPRR